MLYILSLHDALPIYTECNLAFLGVSYYDRCWRSSVVTWFLRYVCNEERNVTEVKYVSKNNAFCDYPSFHCEQCWLAVVRYATSAVGCVWMDEARISLISYRYTSC